MVEYGVVFDAIVKPAFVASPGIPFLDVAVQDECSREHRRTLKLAFLHKRCRAPVASQETEVWVDTVAQGVVEALCRGLLR